MSTGTAPSARDGIKVPYRDMYRGPNVRCKAITSRSFPAANPTWRRQRNADTDSTSGECLVATKARAATVVHIVDDDAAVRDGFVRLLRAAGLEPRAYDSAEAFLDEVRNAPHACVLLDITMPRLTGPQVQARLNERHITLPVITMSARDDDETRAWARILGARLFMRKPIDDQALLDAIDWVTGDPQGR